MVHKSNQMQHERNVAVAIGQIIISKFVHISSKWYVLMFGQWLLNLIDDLTFRLVE